MSTMVNSARKSILLYLRQLLLDTHWQIHRSRISALFVILIVSSAATFFPVIAAKNTFFKINIYVYLFARYFGAGVIIATAFVQ